MSERRQDGALEAEVLAILWKAQGPVTPAEARDRLKTPLAYTTVMTVLTRLWNKGLVARKRSGRGFAYAPVVTEGQLAAERMRAALSATRDREAALTQFVGTLPKRDEQALRKILRELDADR